jgi:hypothetical protein
MNFFEFISNLYNSLTDPSLKYIILYLFVTLIGLVSFTGPSFGFDLINLKMLEETSLETIGFGYPELYFYLGYTLIYLILIVITMYNRLDKCIIEYRKKNPKYEKYSAWDFFTNNASDVLSDVFTKIIGTIVTPFVIFIIITLVYVGLNNVGKFAPPLKIGTIIVNYGMTIIVPIINIFLFIFYFVIIDAAIAC